MVKTAKDARKPRISRELALYLAVTKIVTDQDKALELIAAIKDLYRQNKSA